MLHVSSVNPPLTRLIVCPRFVGGIAHLFNGVRRGQKANVAAYRVLVHGRIQLLLVALERLAPNVELVWQYGDNFEW